MSNLRFKTQIAFCSFKMYEFSYQKMLAIQVDFKVYCLRENSNKLQCWKMQHYFSNLIWFLRCWKILPSGASSWLRNSLTLSGCSNWYGLSWACIEFKDKVMRVKSRSRKLNVIMTSTDSRKFHFQRGAYSDSVQPASPKHRERCARSYCYAARFLAHLRSVVTFVEKKTFKNR